MQHISRACLSALFLLCASSAYAGNCLKPATAPSGQFSRQTRPASIIRYKSPVYQSPEAIAKTHAVPPAAAVPSQPATPAANGIQVVELGRF